MQKKNSVVVARMVEGSRPTKLEDTTQMTKFVRFEFVLHPTTGWIWKNPNKQQLRQNPLHLLYIYTLSIRLDLPPHYDILT
jgi:hypothetical protein